MKSFSIFNMIALVGLSLVLLVGCGKSSDEAASDSVTQKSSSDLVVPACTLTAFPYTFQLNQEAKVEFTWTSSKAEKATLRYLDNGQYVNIDIDLEGTREVILPASFGSEAGVKTFSVMVKSSSDTIMACSALIQYQ